MVIRKILLGSILLGVLMALNAVSAQSVYPLYNECEATDGNEYACPWTPETNFEAINFWLLSSQNIDIRDWVLDMGTTTQVIPDLLPYSGSGTRADRYPISDQVAQDYAVMLHFGVSRGGSCGLAFLYEAETRYYAALVSGDQFYIDQRFGSTPLPVSTSSVTIPFEDLQGFTGSQLLMLVQNDYYIFFVNGQRSAEFTFHPAQPGQNLAILWAGELCDVSLGWMATPLQPEATAIPQQNSGSGTVNGGLSILMPNANQPADNGCADTSNGQDLFFDWTDVDGAVSYTLYVIKIGLSVPIIDVANLNESQYSTSNPGNYVFNTFGWQATVNALMPDGSYISSQPMIFDFEPLDTDCNS